MNIAKLGLSDCKGVILKARSSVGRGDVGTKITALKTEGLADPRITTELSAQVEEESMRAVQQQLKGLFLMDLKAS